MNEIDVKEEVLAKELLKTLVTHRKNVGLRQIDVAEKMGIGQPSVSELEKSLTSPRLSTLSRYARAVGLELVVEIVGLPVPEAAEAVAPGPVTWNE